MRSGELRALEVVEAFLASIERREPSLMVWAWLHPDEARAAANLADAARDAGRPLGRLHGLPVGVKDVFDTFDMPTEWGSPIKKGRRPKTDATIVARLRAAGAIILGKTVTAEFAVYTPGPTRNPHDQTRTPGGSSSGSAAAVAAGMAPAALATQTNGSVIRPASFCGVVGYKPSLGLLPRTGILSQARDGDDEFTFDPPSPGLVDAALAARPPRKLAFVRGPFWPRADVEARQAIEAFASALGSVIESVTLPQDFAEAEEALGRILCCGLAHSCSADFERDGSLMSESLRRMIVRGQSLSATDFLEACTVRDRLRQRYHAIMANYEAMVTLAAPGAAPLFETGTGNPIFSTIWTLLGAPAITLPLLESSEGLPIGVQLVGRLRDDAGLLNAAGWLERRHGDLRRRRE
jgi:Asp-tRNA(Asn)/Glu-tRNA(Gln) amidotransferase A subunit family amidase